MSEKKHSNMLVRSLGIVALMTVFAFAMVPLYNVLCEITGINGKVLVSKELYETIEVDESRVVTVELVTSIKTGMPWEFKTQTKRIDVHPGELHEVNFYARNKSSRTIVGQTVPSVAPAAASFYVSKTECFCFDQQTLVAGEEIDMPMKFFIDPDLPEHVHTVTMSYALFNATPESSAATAGQ